MQDKDFIQFEKDLLEFGIQLQKDQEEEFLSYYKLLVEWNSFMNLTAITEWKDVLKKHFVDSISLIKAVPDLAAKNYKVIDIGTGAGFPGIPLKIIFPNLTVVLLDSLNKRIKFLNTVIDELILDDITAIHGRAEDYSKPGEMREQFDLCVSRAVANMSTLSEYCLPYVKKNGLFISYKSEKINEELNQASKAFTVLGGKLDHQVEFQLPSSDIYRNLVLIKKIKNTPLSFPRKAGLASKEPLC